MNVEQYPDRDAWLVARKEGIGGSDVGVILGLSPYKTRLQLWAEKSGLVEPEQRDTEAMTFGRLLEAPVRSHFTLISGMEVTPYEHAIVRHPEIPHAQCSPDGMLVDGGVYEGKTASTYRRDEFVGRDGEATVPTLYKVQVNWNMLCTEQERGAIATLIGGQQFIWRMLQRHEPLIAVMTARVDEFMQSVADGNAPAPTGHERDRRLLHALNPDDNGETVVLSSTAREWHALKTRAAARVKRATALRDEYDNRIRAEIGANTYGELPGVGRYKLTRVTVKPKDVPAHTREGYTYTRSYFRPERGTK